MAATLLAHTWARGTSEAFHGIYTPTGTVTTAQPTMGGNIDTSGAGLIVASFSSSNARPQVNNLNGNFYDSYGNTWLPFVEFTPSQPWRPLPYDSGGFDENWVAMLYCVNPITGPNHMFALGIGAGGRWQLASFQVAAFSGAMFTLITSTGAGATTSATTIQPGSVTAPAGAVLAVCGLSTYYNQATDATINQAFTVTDFVRGLSPPQTSAFWSEGGAFAYLVDPGAGALNPTWTCDNNTNGRAAQIALLSYEAGGSLIIHKTVQPSNTGQQFSFSIDGGLSPSTFLLANGETQTYEGISAGTYDLTETAVDNWTMTATVSNGSPLNAITVGAGEVVRVDIVNTLNTPPTPSPVIREMRRVRQSPHLWDGKQNKRMFFKAFELLGEMGGPRDDDAVPLQFALEVSKDGGNTWGPRVWQDASFLGQYKFRVIWRMRFQARDCMVRVSDSNAARIIINDLLIEAEEGIN